MKRVYHFYHRRMTNADQVWYMLMQEPLLE